MKPKGTGKNNNTEINRNTSCESVKVNEWRVSVQSPLICSYENCSEYSFSYTGKKFLASWETIISSARTIKDRRKLCTVVWFGFPDLQLKCSKFDPRYVLKFYKQSSRKTWLVVQSPWDQQRLCEASEKIWALFCAAGHFASSTMLH
jgi:hypothetical protein